MRSQNLLIPTPTKGISNCLDEFKSGFPSNGLSKAYKKWWGRGSSDSYDSFFVNGAETEQEDRHQSEELVDDIGGSSLGDKEKTRSGSEESSLNPEGTSLLSTVRKKAVEEGREALKLGVFRGYSINRLGRRKLLLRIVGSSFPRKWKDGSF